MIHAGTVRREIKAQIVMARSHGDGVTMSISIEDKASGCHIVDLRMSLEEFATAVTGGAATASGVAYLNDNIGKKLEVKRVCAPVSDQKNWAVECEQFVKKNYPEWTLDKLGSYNHYNAKPEGYEIILRRWE
jgi:hypothetical protein